MTFVVSDRVRETATTTGTGTFTLLGAVAGYKAFSTIGNSNTTMYVIAHQTLAEFEWGIGTYTLSGTTLARTTVLGGSNGASAVSFSAGTKDVFCSLLAAGYDIDGTLAANSDSHYSSQKAIKTYVDAHAGITALTGDVTGTGPGSTAATLATVNSNVGSFGSATAASVITVNAKGLVTAASSSTVTPAFSSLTSVPTTLSGYGITDAVPSSRTVNSKALSSNITLGLASSDFANQGTTTTVLHGAAAGNPSFSAIVNGDITDATIQNAKLANSAITIAGTSTSLGGTITLDTITGLSSTGLLKRTGANTIAIASSGTDYAAAGAVTSSGLTMATAKILGRSTAGTAAIEEITVGSGLSLSGGSLTATSGGGGTVTNTGGDLTSNAIVLGAGSADSKVVAGIITDGTSVITLGVNTSTLGKVKMFGSTSGDATVQPAAIAGTATVVTLPTATSKLPIYPQHITYTGPSAARTVTYPDANFTVARTDAANTFTGHQTVEGVTSTGATGTGAFVFATTPTLVTPVLGAATGTSLNLSGLTASLPIVTDASKNLISIATPTQAAYLTGTAYSLTNTSAAITGGTTSPTITVTDTGTYKVEFILSAKFVGATFAATKNMTLKLRRTNNTAADLTSGTLPTQATGVCTTYTAAWGAFAWVGANYAATAGDVITVFGDIETAPSAGSIDITGGLIRMTRIF